MKLKEDFALRQIADMWVVLPLGASSISFNGMLTLNESGVFLWKKLEEGLQQDALVAALTSEYSVSTEQAEADIKEFIVKLEDIGCIE